MEWIIITGILAIIIFGIAIFRGNSDRRGVRDNLEHARTINTGLGSIGESQDRVEEGLDKLGENNSDAQRRADDIGRHNQSAKSGIRSAIDILKNAKNRKPNP